MTALVDTGNSAMYLPEQIFDNFKVRRKDEKREEGMEGWRDFGRRYEIKEGSEGEKGGGEEGWTDTSEGKGMLLNPSLIRQFSHAWI